MTPQVVAREDVLWAWDATAGLSHHQPICMKTLDDICKYYIELLQYEIVITTIQLILPKSYNRFLFLLKP